MAITGRPKSQNPKRHNVCIRLTDDEKAELERHYGSAAQGLRHLVNVELGNANPVRTQPRGPEVSGVILDEARVTAVSVDNDGLGSFAVTAPAKAHVHRPAAKVGEVYYRGGEARQRWLCECGQELDRKAS